jgi:CHAT domain-containing protein
MIRPVAKNLLSDEQLCALSSTTRHGLIRSWLCFAFVFAVACASRGQEIEKFVPEPVHHSDRFENDSRKAYITKGDVQWSTLKLTLPPNSILGWVKTLEPDWTCEFDVWPAGVEPDKTSDTHFGVTLSTGLELIVVVTRQLRQGQVLRQVLLANVDRASGTPQPTIEQLAVSPVFTVAGDVERWSVQYKDGIIEVRSDNQLVVRGFSRGLSAWANAFTVAQLAGTVDLTRLEVRGRTTGYTAAQRKIYDQTIELRRKSVVALAAGDQKLAVRTEQQRIPLMQRAFGDQEAGIALAYEWIADVADGMQRYDGVKRYCELAAEAYTKSLGPEHPETLRTHVYAAYATARLGDFDGAEKRAREPGIKYYQLAGAATDRGQQVTQHLVYILNKQALRALAARRYADSQRYLAEIVQIVAASYGADSPYLPAQKARHEFVGTILAAPANKQEELADLALRIFEAGNPETLPSESSHLATMTAILADSRRLLGNEHPYTTDALISVAISEMNRGEFGAAVAKLAEAAETVKDLKGDKSLEYATAELHLASSYSQVERYAEAGPLFEHAKSIFAELNQTQSSTYATLLLEHGRHLMRIDDYPRARQYLTESFALFESLGESHSSGAIIALERLSGIARVEGDMATATTLLQRQQQLLRESGDPVAAHSMTLAAEAKTMLMQGRVSESVAKYQEAASVAAKAYGKGSRAYEGCLEGLVEAYAIQGNAAGVANVFGELLEFARMRRESLFESYTLEQQFQQSATDRVWLDRLMALALDGHIDAKTAYEHLLAIKGAVTIHQRRSHIAATNPKLRKLFDERQRINSELMGSVAQPFTSESAERVQALVNQMDRIDREMSQQSAEYRGATERATVDRLQREMPDGSVIVDYVEFQRPPSWLEGLFTDQPPRILAAFVVAKQGDVKLVNLGYAATVETAVLHWLGSIEAESQNLGPNFDPQLERATDGIGAALRKLIWDPLPPSVAQARSVTISPDGGLTICPFAALPSADGKSYLIEAKAINYISAVGLLPELWNVEAPADEATMLIVGQIDYDNAAGMPPLMIAGGGQYPRGLYFAPLPPEAGDTAPLGSSFSKRFPAGRAEDLLGAKATENQVRARISQATYIYMNTHGFSMPLAELLTLQNPGVEFQPSATDVFVSGIALAGANRSIHSNAASDGILWSDEIATLDLGNTDLVTLSACQTTVGSVFRGEGVHGAQRALLVAGARSSLTALWNVETFATKSVMDGFYSELWSRSQSKPEALRRTMIHMLRYYSWAQAANESAARGHRCPPHLWAAWVLYGDGR